MNLSNLMTWNKDLNRLNLDSVVAIPREWLYQISNHQSRLPGNCWWTKWWTYISSADIPYHDLSYTISILPPTSRFTQIWRTDPFPLGKLSRGVFHIVSWKSTGGGIQLAFILPSANLTIFNIWRISHL